MFRNLNSPALLYPKTLHILTPTPSASNSSVRDCTGVGAAPFLPKPLKPELAIRVYGVDTPEKGHRAQCPSEAQRGEAASAFTKNAIAQAAATGGKIQVTMYSWDKFGGRVLGDILVNGQSLRAALIANGFAREYYGDAKQSWCN